jgi:DNA-binding response OmpR family regulator
MISGYTVLMLTEDSHLYRKLGRVLENKGCRVLWDNTQVEAVHIRQIDLILAQVNAEVGQNLTVLKQFKRLNPQVRVVLCTREGETAFPVEAYQLEVDDYLLMPCTPAEFWRRMAACLQRSPGNSVDSAVASWLPTRNGAILEELNGLFSYIRYTLDSVATAFQPLISTPESTEEEKIIAKICEVSARLEILQEMADGFLQGISGMKVTCFIPCWDCGRRSRFHS